MVTLRSHIRDKIEVVHGCPNMLLIQSEVVLFCHSDRGVAQKTTDRVNVNSLFDKMTYTGRTQAVQVDLGRQPYLACPSSELLENAVWLLVREHKP